MRKSDSDNKNLIESVIDYNDKPFRIESSIKQRNGKTVTVTILKSSILLIRGLLLQTITFIYLIAKNKNIENIFLILFHEWLWNKCPFFYENPFISLSLIFESLWSS